MASLSRHAADWEGIWVDGVGKGQRFDIAMPHKILQQFISEGIIPNGNALVPGCGRGYDVHALASKDRFVTGMDMSPTGIAEAKKHLSTVGVSMDWYALVCGDFFQEFIKQQDFIYDYTFLCALPPHMRQEWANHMALLLRPDGILMTLQFPLGHYGTTHPADAPLDFTKGPPYLLTPALYHDLLDSKFECIREEPVPVDMSFPSRAGIEAVALWRRKAQY